MTDKEQFIESLRRARANLDAWTREFRRASHYFPVVIGQRADGVTIVRPQRIGENVLRFPMGRTRRPKSEHTYEWKG